MQFEEETMLATPCGGVVAALVWLIAVKRRTQTNAVPKPPFMVLKPLPEGK